MALDTDKIHRSSLPMLSSKPREGRAIRQSDVSTAWGVCRAAVPPLNISSNDEKCGIRACFVIVDSKLRNRGTVSKPYSAM